MRKVEGELDMLSTHIPAILVCAHPSRPAVLAFSANSLPISDCGRLMVTMGCRVRILGPDPVPVPVARLLPVSAPVLLADVLLGLDSVRCCAIG